MSYAQRFHRRTPRLIALACALLCATVAWADIVSIGSIGVGPVFSPIGPGNTVLPTSGVWVGSPGVGNLTVDQGSFLKLARVAFGSGGTGVGTGLFSGAGTRVELVGDGASNSQVERLMVGDFGTGELSVNAGAVLDTRGNPAPCLLAFHYCDSFVGGAAGDTGVLNIDGAGSQVRIGQNLFVAQPGLAIQHLDGYTYGVPGGTTRGTVNVTNGGLLSTDRATIAPRHWSTNATGHERNLGEVNVSGAGSRWVVVGGNTVDHSNGNVFEGGAYVLTANDRNAWATINVTGGGVIDIQGQSGVYNGINLTNGGGRTDMLISGAGSKVLTSGPNGYLQVGRRLGTANLSVLDGGVAEGLVYLAVGRDASFGDLLIDGAGSRISVTRYAELAAQGSQDRAPAINIGRDGNGQVSVLNGGLLEVVGGAEFSTNSPHLTLGVGTASAGVLKVQGGGSQVELRSNSLVPGGGAGEAFNPYMSVGYEGSGTLEVSGGAMLLMQGDAVSTAANVRGTALYIGGRGSDTPGGKGIGLVSGAGSAIKVQGADAFIGVGSGAGANGQLTINQDGLVEATIMNVGRNAVGVLSMNNAMLNMTGQYTSTGFGAALSIGNRGGVGVANISNGSRITISNMGSAGASLNLGGTSPNPLGDGSLTLSGGSQIHVLAATGLASATVGRDGSGFLRVKGASLLDVGDGALYVGRLKGGDGTVIVSEASSLKAGWVGVGRNKTSTGDVDGGTGTLVLINSTLTAQNIVIGSNGFLGGTGTISGNVVNHGIFAPGNSPGTVEITGSFEAAAGSRMILEVQSDGHGGFATDQVIFGAGQALDLAHLSVEYRFLGNTNPNDFQAQHLFGVDTFFQMRSTGGGTAGLAPQAFSGTSFSAQADGYTITNFSFSASGGAVFNATPVPEPDTWAMLLSGLVGLVAVTRLGGTAARRRDNG